MIRTRRKDSGFAMLLVFAMAAAVSIMLYKELPRLVFESQRIKEQELVYRGEEYKRAIQLYVRKFKKYPASLDELENSTEVRFLRRRYKDPMTGNDEWRLIHIDNMGFYTDSLIHKPKEEEGDDTQNTFITEGAAFGSTGPPPGMEDQQNTGANVRGASDRPVADVEQFRGSTPLPGQPGAELPPSQNQPPQPDGQNLPPGAQPPLGPGQQGQQPYPQGQQPGQPSQYPYPPGQQPDQQVQPYPQQGVPGLPGPYGQQQPQQETGVPPVPNPSYPVGLNQPMVPQQGQPMGQIPTPIQGIPGLPGPYGQQPQQQPGAPPAPNPSYPAGLNRPMSPQQQQPRQPGRPVFGFGGQSPFQQGGTGGANPGAGQPGGGNAALGMIQQILTTPRPGGLSGVAGQQQAAAGGVPGGIAGVATTAEAEGIMVYNERTKYNEWEFLYNYSEEQQNAAQAAARGAGATEQSNPLGGPGAPGNRGSSFGGTGGQGSGFGQGSSFGQGPSQPGGSFGNQPRPPAPGPH